MKEMDLHIDKLAPTEHNRFGVEPTRDEKVICGGQDNHVAYEHGARMPSRKPSLSVPEMLLLSASQEARKSSKPA